MQTQAYTVKHIQKGLTLLTFDPFDFSVPSNIAEGCGRASNRDYAHFLSIARGSLYETMTQLELAQSLGYIDAIANVEELASEISRMLTSLIKKYNPFSNSNSNSNCFRHEKWYNMQQIGVSEKMPKAGAANAPQVKYSSAYPMGESVSQHYYVGLIS